MPTANRFPPTPGITKALAQLDRALTPTTIKLSAYSAKRNTSGSLAVIFDLTGKPDPLPTEIISIRTTADAVAARQAYLLKAIATGLPLAVSMRHHEGRKPNGFDKEAKSAPYVWVNV